VPTRRKTEEDRAIGRSHGGLSTKIHALADALTGGEARDLVGADYLLPGLSADALIGTRRSMPRSASSSPFLPMTVTASLPRIVLVSRRTAARLIG
jgi:hypothetical protein